MESPLYDRRTLSSEHSVLSVTAAELTNLLRAESPDLEALGALRWRMSRLLFLHLAQEDHSIPSRARWPNDSSMKWANLP